jgi:SAM-dependent methyltransferase
MRAAIQFLQEHIETVSTDSIYLTEMVTPLYEFLQARYPLLQASEYLPAVPLGASENGIRSEDLLSLTFDDNSFDVILTFDVLEHVSEYKIALHELARTLKPGGHLIMTAPMIVDSEISHTRAVMNDDGEIQHLLPPEYHGNPLGPPSLCFTTFGFDVVEQLRKFGFCDSFAQLYYNVELGYWGNPEVLLIATK